MATTPCPTCGKPVPLATANRPPSYPFCSSRCRLVDLGKWFNEEYRISTQAESPEEVERLLEEQRSRDKGATTTPREDEPDEL
jgi:uncharacterized protein